ncbi:hypothetical protein [Anaeromusa acidaminophila]|uniref:hypothetical protein n=1 Tax=Anaeromusa acidaminophila TaxID=81464 RepID=UPI00035DBD4E|nr:hypothetical protein [Anaeromusa acidaminophila]
MREFKRGNVRAKKYNDSSSVEACMQRAYKSEQEGAYMAAMQEYQLALRNQHVSEAYQGLAKINYLIGDYNEAAVNWLRYIFSNGATKEVLTHLGHALVDEDSNPLYRKKYLATLEQSSNIELTDDLKTHEEYCRAAALNFLKSMNKEIAWNP